MSQGNQQKNKLTSGQIPLGREILTVTVGGNVLYQTSTNASKVLNIVMHSNNQKESFSGLTITDKLILHMQ